MLNKFSFLKRRADLTPGQFSQHWRTRHVQVLVEQGGHKTYNKRYVQNHFLHDCGIPGLSEVFDGAAQMVPQHAGVVTRGFQEDPLYAQFVRPDERLFLDVTRCLVLYCDTRAVLPDGEAGGFKLLQLLKRRAGTSHAQFMATWQRHGTQLVARPGPRGGLAGYLQHEVRQDAMRGMGAGEPVDDALAFDGVAEWRFRALPSLQALLQSADWGALDAAASAFVDAGSLAFVAREEPIYDDT